MLSSKKKILFKSAIALMVSTPFVLATAVSCTNTTNTSTTGNGGGGGA